MDLILFGKLISPLLPQYKTQSGNLVKHRKAIGGNLAFYGNTQGKWLAPLLLRMQTCSHQVWDKQQGLYLSAKQKCAVARTKGLSTGKVCLPANMALLVTKCLEVWKQFCWRVGDATEGKEEQGEKHELMLGLWKWWRLTLASCPVPQWLFVCVCNTVGSLEWESPGWQPSVWLGSALRSGICLFSGSVSVLIYTEIWRWKHSQMKAVFIFLLWPLH